MFLISDRSAALWRFHQQGGKIPLTTQVSTNKKISRVVQKMSKQNQQYIKALQYTKEQLYMVQQQGLCVSVKHCKALYCEHKYFRGAERTAGQSNL